MAQEGENKLIDIQGIARGGSDLDCADGMCNEVVGLVYEQGQLKPYSLESLGVEVTGYSRIYIHNTSAGKNYIFVTDNGRVLWDSELYIMSHKDMPYNPYTDYSEGERDNLYPRHEIGIDLSTTTPNVSFLGNLMSIDCNNIYLFEGGEYKEKAKNGSVGFRAAVGIKANGYVMCVTNCANKEMQDDERVRVTNHVREAARKLNSCVGFSYMRYGIRNYNGEYIYLSNPVLVSDGEFSYKDNEKPPVDKDGYMKHYRPNDNGGRWDDIVGHARRKNNYAVDENLVGYKVTEGGSWTLTETGPGNLEERAREQLGKRWLDRDGVTKEDFTVIRNDETDFFCEEKVQFHYPNGELNEIDYPSSTSLCIVEDVDDGGVGWDVVTKAIGFTAYRQGTSSSRTDDLYESFFPPRKDAYLKGKKQAMYVAGVAGRDIDRTWLSANGMAQRLINVPTIRIDSPMPEGLENYVLSVDILATRPIDMYKDEDAGEAAHKACAPYNPRSEEDILNYLKGSSEESGAGSQTYNVICRIPYDKIVKLKKNARGTTYVIRANGKKVWEEGEINTDSYTVTGEEGISGLRWGVQYQYNSRLHVADITYESFLGAGASIINPNNNTLLNRWMDRLACHTTCYNTIGGKNPYRKWNAIGEEPKLDCWWYKTPDGGDRLIPVDRFSDDVKGSNYFDVSRIYPMSTPFSFTNDRITSNDITLLESGDDGAMKLYNLHKGNGGDSSKMPAIPKATQMRVHDATQTFFKKPRLASYQGRTELIDFNSLRIAYPDADNNGGGWEYIWYSDADAWEKRVYTPSRFYEYYDTLMPAYEKNQVLQTITGRVTQFGFSPLDDGDMVGEELLMLVKSTRYSAKETGAQKETVIAYNIIPVSLYAIDLFNSICLPGKDWSKFEIVGISGVVYKTSGEGYEEKERRLLPINKVYSLENTNGQNDCKWIGDDFKYETLDELFDIAKESKPTTLREIFETIKQSIRTDDAPKYIFRVSNTNSLETFDIANEYYSGRGDVIGFASNSNDISTGQFGEFPLYVFTTEGVFSYKVDESGAKAYSTSSPISRDVCNNRNSICETRDMVLFSSVRGLYCIRGGAVYHLSEIINGEPTDVAIYDDTEWRKGNGLAVYGKAISSDGIVIARDAISENTQESQIADFRKFLSDSNTFLSYNYESDIVLASNTEKNYSYTIQLFSENQCFVSKLHSRVNYSINNYPDDKLSCKSLEPVTVEEKGIKSVPEIVSVEFIDKIYEKEEDVADSVELNDENTETTESQVIEILNMPLDASSLLINESIQDNPSLVVSVDVTSMFDIINNMFKRDDGSYSSYLGGRFLVRCKNDVAINSYTVVVRGENDEVYYNNTENVDERVLNVQYIDSDSYRFGNGNLITDMIYTRTQSSPILPNTIRINENGEVSSFTYNDGQGVQEYGADEMETVLGCVWSLSKVHDGEGSDYSAIGVVVNTVDDSFVYSRFILTQEQDDARSGALHVEIPLTSIGNLSNNTYRISVTARCTNTSRRTAEYYDSSSSVPSMYYSGITVISTVGLRVRAALSYKEEFKQYEYHDEEYVEYKDVYSDSLYQATYDGNVSEAKDVVIQTRPIKINNDTFKQAFRVSLRGDLNIEEGKTVGLYVMASNDCEKWMYIGGTEHSSSMGNPMVNIGTTIERFSYRYIMVVFAGRLMANSRIRAIEISKNYKYNKKLR